MELVSFFLEINKNKDLINWNTAIKKASLKGLMNVVIEIINKAPENYKFKWNEGLYCAVIAECMILIKFFIDKGANNWNYGLISACSAGNINLIDFFIEKGANNLNYGFEEARLNGDIDIMRYLVQKGADDVVPVYFN